MIVSPRKTAASPKRSIKSPAKTYFSPKRTLISENSKTTTLSFHNQSMNRIPSISNPNLYFELKLSGTRLTSFEGMITMASIEVLRIDNSRIESFKGAKLQPSLEYFIVKGSPLSLYELCPIMSRIVFGPSLKFVGNHPLSKEEKETADHLSSLLHNWLVTGWLLTSANPIRIYNPVTHARKKLFLLEDFVPITMHISGSPIKPITPAPPSTPSTELSKAKDEELLRNVPEEELIITEEEEEGDAEIDNAFHSNPKESKELEEASQKSKKLEETNQESKELEEANQENKKLEETNQESKELEEANQENKELDFLMQEEEEHSKSNQDDDEFQEKKELENLDLGDHELDKLDEKSDDINDLLLDNNDVDLGIDDLDLGIDEDQLLNQDDEEDAISFNDLINNSNSDVF